MYFSYKSKRCTILFASLVNDCGLYARSTALSNALCAFNKAGGIVRGSYKSASELSGNRSLASSKFCAAVSMAATCLALGFLFRFIAADTTVISEEDYNKIINFYVDKLHCQRIAWKG